MREQTYLRVPGDWLEICGFGTEDRIFPILDIHTMEVAGRTKTFVTVDRGGKAWIIDKDVRRAEYVHREE